MGVLMTSYEVIMSEFRRNPRPWPPRPSLAVRFDQAIVNAAGSLRRHWLGRAVFFSLIAACIGTVWWSAYVRLPLVKDSQAHVRRVYSLRHEIDRLKQGWRQDRMKKERDMLARYEMMLMPDLETLDTWLRDQVHAALALGMRVSWRIEAPRPESGIPADVQILPVLMKFDATSGPLDFASALKFLQSIISSGWHVDISRTDMTGRGEGMEHMTVTLRVWLKNSDEIHQLSHEGKEPA